MVRPVNVAQETTGNQRGHLKSYEERWMTVVEVAAYLQLSRAKIYELAQNGEIPCVKVARQWRFKRAQLDRWLSEQVPGGVGVSRDGGR